MNFQYLSQFSVNDISAVLVEYPALYACGLRVALFKTSTFRPSSSLAAANCGDDPSAAQQMNKTDDLFFTQAGRGPGKVTQVQQTDSTEDKLSSGTGNQVKTMLDRSAYESQAYEQRSDKVSAA